MERTIVVSLMLLGLFMLFLPDLTIAQLSPLCISQFALANQACAVLPSVQAPKGRNQTRSQADDTDSSSDDDDDDDDSDDDDDDDEDVGDGNDSGKGDERERRRRHGQKRSRKHGKKHQGRKHGKHGRKHGGGHSKEPRANRDCCRWLEELNESCVCGALLRLPPFLVKPKHEYSIKVGKSCRFTYNCYGV